MSNAGPPLSAPVRLVYFAWVRERIGLAEETVQLPAALTTIADLMAWLKTRGETYAHAFDNAGIIRAAIDHTHAGPEAPIGAAREIAFFPPMTGG
jgi:sulfur-carrier protein